MNARDAPWTSRPPTGSSPSVMHACSLVAAVWCELAVVQWTWPGPSGVLASFAGASAIVWTAGRAARPPAYGRSALALGGAFRSVLRLASRAALGVVVWPWLAQLTGALFGALGGRIAVLRPADAGLLDVAALLVVAPLFEEALYRGGLLAALRASLGAPLALVISAAAFALPHLDPLRVLGAFLAGLVLGAVFVFERRVSSCVAAHAGFNAAALWLHCATRCVG